MIAIVSRWSTLAAVLALAITATVGTMAGGRMFSPGALSAAGGAPLGGVRSHAELASSCASCHVAPWSRETMDARCLACHDDVRAELGDSTTLHGAFASAERCRTCHTEHHGATGELTRFDGRDFDHDRTSFPLTGAHAAVACAGCHRDAAGAGAFAGAPTTCIGCHRADDTHRGSMGTDCAACHGTARWDDVSFEHRFPLDHGESGASECAVCHQDAPVSYERYTCYGCHEHTPARIQREHDEEGISRAELPDCMSCHPTGREHEGDRGRRQRRRD